MADSISTCDTITVRENKAYDIVSTLSLFCG